MRADTISIHELKDTNSPASNLFPPNFFDRLGAGIVQPVAYDTAWLARIPDFPNIKKPAFPEVLAWLRDHQLKDGSWGSDKPFNAHGNTLSTLAAILALAQWNHSEDHIYIIRGLAALENLAQQLENEAHETIGFELLLPALLNECKKYDLVIPTTAEKHYLKYQQMSAEKQKLIVALATQYGNQQAASWWFSLEMLNGYPEMAKAIEFDLGEFMLSYGSVAASPAATAYLLMELRFRGYDLPAAYDYLYQLSQLNNQHGYLPNVAPIDEFELAFPANYFLQAGIPATDPNLKKLISKVADAWQQRTTTGIGYSSHFFIDPDCSATAMRVLKLAHYAGLDVKILLKFFNGLHIETYKGERSPSISANLHVLDTLRLLEPTPEINQVIKSIVAWLEQQSQASGPIFNDKWHFSAIYPISRAIFALEGLHHNLAERCVNWLIEHQHENGGWGMQNATAEETAFASLALANWHKKYPLNSSLFIKAQQYLQRCDDLPEDTLWIGKVLYCPKFVVASIVAAARYAVNNLLKEIILNEQLQEEIASREYVTFDLGSIQSPEPLHLQGKLLCTSKTYQANHLEDVEKHNQEWAITLGLCQANDRILKAGLTQGSACAFRQADHEALKIYNDYVLLLLILDDVLDDAWENLGDLSQLKLVFHKLLKNFKGEIDISEDNHHFPKLTAFCQAFYDLGARLKQKNKEIIPVIKAIEELFNYLIKEFEHRKQNKKISSQEHLDIRLVAGGMNVPCEFAFALQHFVLRDELRMNEHFLSLKYHANKASVIANDLLSLVKELKHGGKDDNYVILKMKENNLSLQTAFNACLNDYNREILKFFDSKQALLITHDNDKHLQQAIQIIANHVQAHIDWALHTLRYSLKA